MKFTEDPRIVFGTTAGPEPDRVLMRGTFAKAMGVLPSAPSKEIKPVFVLERRFPRVRVRGYHASVGGHVWISPGYTTMSVLYLVRALWRRWREPVPRAWVHR